MKKQILVVLLMAVATLAQAQDRFPKSQLSINGFRNPSIGLEYQRNQFAVHAGYYVTNFESGVTTEFHQGGSSLVLTWWAFAILGEHLGQLFTIIWTIMMTTAFAQLKLFPKWVILLGYGSSIIYLFAQAELFATVIPNVPVIDWAGFLGSTLWILWLLIIGVKIR